MNLPNKLSLIRLCLVPVILAVGIIPESILPFYASCVICAVLFIVTSLTDMLDGKIARKYGLITDFGKFIDPVADKFMVIGTLFVILYKFENLKYIMLATLIIVVFRELAVTSIRLVVSTGEGIVVAANNLGKIKTVSQVIAICTVFLEPVLQKLAEVIYEAVKHTDVAWRTDIVPLTWITLAFSLIMTVWSGINYLASYWKYFDPEK